MMRMRRGHLVVECRAYSWTIWPSIASPKATSDDQTVLHAKINGEFRVWQIRVSKAAQ